MTEKTTANTAATTLYIRFSFSDKGLFGFSNGENNTITIIDNSKQPEQIMNSTVDQFSFATISFIARNSKKDKTVELI